MPFIVEIDSEICKGCGLCVPECSKGVLKIGEPFNQKGWQYAVVVNTDDCIGCKRCATVCPDVAIRILKKA